MDHQLSWVALHVPKGRLKDLHLRDLLQVGDESFPLLRAMLQSECLVSDRPDEVHDLSLVPIEEHLAGVVREDNLGSWHGTFAVAIELFDRALIGIQLIHSRMQIFAPVLALHKSENLTGQPNHLLAIRSLHAL